MGGGDGSGAGACEAERIEDVESVREAGFCNARDIAQAAERAR